MYNFQKLISNSNMFYLNHFHPFFSFSFELVQLFSKIVFGLIRIFSNKTSYYSHRQQTKSTFSIICWLNQIFDIKADNELEKDNHLNELPKISLSKLHLIRDTMITFSCFSLPHAMLILEKRLTDNFRFKLKLWLRKQIFSILTKNYGIRLFLGVLIRLYHCFISSRTYFAICRF